MGKYLHKAVGASIIIYHAIVDLLLYLVQNQGPFSAMSGDPRLSPLMLYEFTQRHNGHK